METLVSRLEYMQLVNRCQRCNKALFSILDDSRHCFDCHRAIALARWQEQQARESARFAARQEARQKA